MKYLVLIMLLSFLAFTVDAQVNQSQGRDQFILKAIQDFSKTKLYKRDSVFYVTQHDTFYRVAFDTISKNNYRGKRGKAYPNITTVDILGFPYKYFLDTAMDLSNQKWIPNRFIEQNGKIFIWWDKLHPLTDVTIKVLDKYHLIGRGKGDD